MRVINGVDCYTIGMSKLLHYSLFELAGLSTPKYRIVRNHDEITDHNLNYPLLLKPNAGGFGKGIIRLDNPSTINGIEAFENDGIAILQEYIRPRGGLV